MLKLYHGHDLRWTYYVNIVNIVRKRVEDQTYQREFKIERFGGNVKVELDLSSYATKADWKRLKGADTSKLAAKTDLASLKAQINCF